MKICCSLLLSTLFLSLAIGQEPVIHRVGADDEPMPHTGLDPSGQAIGLFVQPVGTGEVDWANEPLFVDGEPRGLGKLGENAKTLSIAVYAVADEEFRAYHSNWQNLLYQIIETADNAWYRDYDINWVIQGYYSWTSNGGSAATILADLASDGSGLPGGLTLGFTRDSNFGAGSIAYVYTSDPCNGYSVYFDQGVSSTAAAVTEGVKRNYGCSSSDPDGCPDLIKEHREWFQCAD